VGEDHFITQFKPSRGLVCRITVVVTLSFKKCLQELGSLEGNA